MQSSYPILIVGTGFSGIAMAIRLKRAGIDDFIMLEQGADVGGTWRDNHYPGAACDVRSHLYSFSFEPNPNWTQTFAPQGEILAYLRHCARKYGLLPHIRFQTTVTRAVYDAQLRLWQVRADGGETFMGRVLVLGTGGLSRPAYPDIPGLHAFQGTTFHTARWDHDTPLDGKRVAVIGTGASAIQVVPAIAPRVGHLEVFQRTPPWIVPKDDPPISPAARAWFRRLPWLQKLKRGSIWLRNELYAIGFTRNPGLLAWASQMARRYLEAQVSDPELRMKLTPDYTMGCKRILLSNDYYAALQRENCELVTEGIQEIRSHAIVTRDGREHDVDAIVLATGFQAAESVAPFEIRGREGQRLNDAWSDGAEAYLGTSVAGFPNLFMMAGPNTALGHSSMVLMIEAHARYILDAIRTLRKRELASVEVTKAAQDRYNRELRTRLSRTVWAVGGCSSWYRTRTGKITTLWPGFTFEFGLRTRRFDAESYMLERQDDVAATPAGAQEARQQAPAQRAVPAATARFAP